MSTPDDLTEAEAIDLQRLLGEAGTRVEIPTTPPEEARIDLTDEEYEAFTEGLRPQMTVILPQFVLDAETGSGRWNGHEFILSPDQLKRVHTIFTECIAAKLTAEIERLRGEVS